MSEAPLQTENPNEGLLQRLSAYKATQIRMVRHFCAVKSRPPRPKQPAPSLPPPCSAAIDLCGFLLALPPFRFSGDPKACHGFVYQCNIHLKLQLQHFPSDRAKVVCCVPALWGCFSLNCSTLVIDSITTYLDLFKKVFKPAQASSIACAIFHSH